MATLTEATEVYKTVADPGFISTEGTTRATQAPASDMSTQTQYINSAMSSSVTFNKDVWLGVPI